MTLLCQLPYKNPMKSTHTRLDLFTQPFRQLMEKESSGGIVLFASGVLGLLIANSVYAESYKHFLHLPVNLSVGAVGLKKTLQHFINDGLMAVFFFLVGLEIKRELLVGDLSRRDQAILPLVAAVFGMAVPALIYVAFVAAEGGGSDLYRGWAIPSATDIAFAIGIIALVGRGVPVGLKVLLVAIAIIDDLGAILVIAIFYTPQISLLPLLLGIIILFALSSLNRSGVASLLPYVLLGIVLWVCVLNSAVHATIAGVLTAFCIPLRLKNAHGVSPLIQMEHSLAPWVNFGILPLFGFVNSGVSFAEIGSFSALLLHPVTLGISCGLFFGKQIGITGTIWLLVKMGWGRMPQGCGWMHIYAMSLMCGIGFTISLFIGALSYADSPLIAQARIGVFIGSLSSAALGFFLMKRLAKQGLASSPLRKARVRLPNKSKAKSQRNARRRAKT